MMEILDEKIPPRQGRSNLGSSKPRSKFPAKSQCMKTGTQRVLLSFVIADTAFLNRNVLAPILAVDNYFPAYAALFEMSLPPFPKSPLNQRRTLY